MTANIVSKDGWFYLSTPYSELNAAKCRDIPNRKYIPSQKAWLVRRSLTNMEYIVKTWPDAKWDEESWAYYQQALAKLNARVAVRDGKADVDTSVLDGVPFAMMPRLHQKKALVLGRDQEEFAYLMDPGTGKTKVLIDDAAHNFREGRIEALIVFAPNSVKTNWVAWDHMLEEDEKDALTAHCPPDVSVVKGVWSSAATGIDKRCWKAFEEEINARGNRLIVMVVNYEAATVPRFYRFLEAFCKTFKTMIALDESTRIGTPGAERTKAILKLARLATLRRILSGTPVIKNPLKAYSQFKFLNEDILGSGSFTAFRAEYCTMGGFEGRQVLGYKNLDKLSDLIASCSFRVLKSECLDLPPQQYHKKRPEMTAKQVAAYKDMMQKMSVEMDGVEITAKIALSQMMRFQQITGGYLSDGDKVIEIVKPEHNPKMQEVLGILDESGDRQVIIWCRFREEIAGLATLLKREGHSFYEFHGGVPENERFRIRKDFWKGKAKIILGNAGTGGIGIDEFKVASIVIYYSNDFDTEKRVQSEDRAHRDGSEIHDAIDYYDLICPNTVDVKIVRSLRTDRKISDAVMKDGLRSWI